MEYIQILEAVKGNDTNVKDDHLAKITIVPEPEFDISDCSIKIVADTVQAPAIEKNFYDLQSTDYVITLDYSAEETKRMKSNCELTFYLVDPLGKYRTIGIALLVLKEFKNV